MKLHTLFLMVLATGALALTGCVKTVNTVEGEQKTGHANIVPDKRVVTDETLGRQVSVMMVNTAMTPGGLLKVQIQLRNGTYSLARFNYRFEWFDENGMQINNVISALIPDQIEGSETKLISAVAPNPACMDFRVKFIAAN